jgi:hypothetical protein
MIWIGHMYPYQAAMVIGGVLLTIAALLKLSCVTEKPPPKPSEGEAMVYAILIVCLIIGVPVAFSIVTTLMYFMAVGEFPYHLRIVATQMFGGMRSYPLLAIPLFILAGRADERIRHHQPDHCLYQCYRRVAAGRSGLGQYLGVGYFCRAVRLGRGRHLRHRPGLHSRDGKAGLSAGFFGGHYRRFLGYRPHYSTEYPGHHLRPDRDRRFGTGHVSGRRGARDPAGHLSVRVCHAVCRTLRKGSNGSRRPLDPKEKFSFKASFPC